MTTQGKQTTAYVLAGLGLAAGIGGYFYASKKGYKGWDVYKMMILFAAPFSIPAGVLASQNNGEETTKSSATYTEICDDGTRTTEFGGCNEHGGAIGYEQLCKDGTTTSDYGGCNQHGGEL
jgi:hypothetical protein